MGLLHASLEYSQDVVGQHCRSEPEQGGLWAAESFDFTFQDRFQSLEHTFNAPAAAIELRDLLSADAFRQVAPEHQAAVTRVCWRMKRQFDAPTLVTASDLDDLLTHRACFHRHGFLPLTLLNQAWMFGLLANDKGRLDLLTSFHYRKRAVESVSQPHLARFSISQQRQHANALAGVGILTCLKVDDLIEIRIVDHYRKTGTSRTSLLA